MMITGDYHQTAVAVAWGVSMVPAGGVVHVIDKLPVTAAFSPPSSPVQLSSTRSLFPRELEDASQKPFAPWSNLRPSTGKPAEVRLDPVLVDPVAVSRDALLEEALQPEVTRLAARGRVVPAMQPSVERTTGDTPLTRLHSTLKVTTSLDSDSQGLPRSTLESQDSVPFRLQCDGQRFLLGTGDVRQDDEATRALTSIAEGQAQCAITGAAFEHLLQQEDLAVLQAVLQNAVVFARMRPHQKAQVLSLLGAGGLHQVFQGRHRHIPVSPSAEAGFYHFSCSQDCGKAAAELS